MPVPATAHLDFLLVGSGLAIASAAEKLLESLRKTARREEWPALSSGYRLEIERMQREILDYLVEGTLEARADAPA
jgi:hypothetical protein